MAFFDASVIVVTLALGVGANAAMFGVVDRLLFRVPAYLRDPDLVNRVYVIQPIRGTERALSLMAYARYQDLVSNTSSFSLIAGANKVALPVMLVASAAAWPSRAI